ncbi:MAG: T9SS type A sorting domain-containing protein, partial [Flavobacteriales bacterium]
PIDTERLIYTIRFQNTGNDTATTVVIHDQLSPQLDHGSLQVLGWTHPFTLSVEAGGEALFTFNNIMLPDSGADQLGSQGHLIFSIAPLPASPAGTVIENTARIVFDLNEPVITNSTLNTLFDCLLASTSIADLGDNTLLAGPGLHYQWALDGVDLPGADQQALVATESGSYTVTVTDSIGCTPTSAPYALIITAVAALNASSIITHPDPFTHTTTVVLPTDPADGTVLQVIDAQGRCVMLVPANSRSITLHGDELGTGVFTLRCITKDGSIYRVGRVVHLR